MSSSYLIAVSTFLCVFCSAVQSESFNVGPIYPDQADKVDVLIQLRGDDSPEASEFSLRQNQKILSEAVGIQSFGESGRGLSVVITVDTSGSMKGQLIHETKRALREFLHRIRNEDRISIALFSDHTTASEFSNDLTVLEPILENVKAQGKKTFVFDAIFDSTEHLISNIRAIPQHKRVVIITDGRDEGGIRTVEDVIGQAKKEGIFIDVLLMGGRANSQKEVFQRITDETGGYFENIVKPEIQLVSAVANLEQKILENHTKILSFNYEKGELVDATQKNINIFWDTGDGRSTSNQVRGLIPLPIAQLPPVLPEKVISPEKIPEETNFLSVLLPLLLLFALILFFIYLLNRRKVASHGRSEKIDTVSSSFPSSSPQRKTVVGSARNVEQITTGKVALRVEAGAGLEGQSIPINKSNFRIGANDENDLILKNDAYVSGNHAYLTCQNGDLVIYDQGSTNGTIVNNNTLKNRSSSISYGDVIILGGVTLKVMDWPTSSHSDEST